MATIYRKLSSKRTPEGKSQIMLRVSARRNCNFWIPSGIFVERSRFNQDTSEFIMPRANQTALAQLRETEARLIEMEQFILSHCATNPHASKEEVIEALDRKAHPEKHAEKSLGDIKGFFALHDEFLKEKNYPEGTEKQHRLLLRTLSRYDQYSALEGKSKEGLSFSHLENGGLQAFRAFVENEEQAKTKYPHIYEGYNGNLKRSRNTTIATLSRLRIFLNWCLGHEYIKTNPFDNFSLGAEKYGTPIYITSEERDTIANYDLSEWPSLSVQRDIFIFQCYIGCRVSDLIRLKKSDIVNGEKVEYVAQKTKGHDPKLISVPLHPTALTIVKKYDEVISGTRLFPFISEQKYSQAIKQIFLKCGITRLVSRLNPHTGEEEKVPICEIASSHMARRTFVGRLYSQTKDPNLICALSGHAEGSKAFARYRHIDEEIKKDVISLL